MLPKHSVFTFTYTGMRPLSANGEEVRGIYTANKRETVKYSAKIFLPRQEAC
jgi:hypothetical protein